MPIIRDCTSKKSISYTSLPHKAKFTFTGMYILLAYILPSGCLYRLQARISFASTLHWIDWSIYSIYSWSSLLLILSCCVCQVHPVPQTAWWWRRLQIAQHSSHGALAETMGAQSLAMSSRPEHPSLWAGKLWTQVLYILSMKGIESFWYEGMTQVQ